MHEAHNANDLLLIKLLQESKRMANSEAVDSKGAMVTLYTNQSKLHDLRAKLHYSPVPHIK